MLLAAIHFSTPKPKKSVLTVRLVQKFTVIFTLLEPINEPSAPFLFRQSQLLHLEGEQRAEPRVCNEVLYDRHRVVVTRARFCFLDGGTDCFSCTSTI